MLIFKRNHYLNGFKWSIYLLGSKGLKYFDEKCLEALLDGCAVENWNKKTSGCGAT